MTRPESPLKRPIRVPKLVRGLITVAIVVAVGAAIATRSYILALVGLAFAVLAVALARHEGI